MVKTSPYDLKDVVYRSRNTKLKQSVDLRELDSLIEDQGNLGSCVGNAITNSYELMVRKIQLSKI